MRDSEYDPDDVEAEAQARLSREHMRHDATHRLSSTAWTEEPIGREAVQEKKIELPAPAYSVELLVKGNSHSYRVRVLPGQESIYPGVTGILGIINKPALVNWSKRETVNRMRAGLLKQYPSLALSTTRRVTVSTKFITELLDEALKHPDKIKDAAADLGTQAHAYIDAIVKGGRPGNLPNEILKPVAAFCEWWSGCGIVLVLGDTKVASLIHQYGGSLDAVGWDSLHECLVILDWKTSKSVYEEYALQVAAYVRAFEEMYGVKIPRAIIVRFAKDGASAGKSGFEVVELRDIEKSFQAFLRAKELAEAMRFEHLVRD